MAATVDRGLRGAARWVTVVGGVAVFACALLPWASSGRAQRSSYALARSAQALELVTATWQKVLVVGWYLMPLGVALLWLAAVARRAFVVAGLGTAVGALALAGAFTVRTSTLHAEFGTTATIAAGGLAVAGALATAWTHKEIR